jgi:hypothetical protein
MPQVALLLETSTEYGRGRLRVVLVPGRSFLPMLGGRGIRVPHAPHRVKELHAFAKQVEPVYMVTRQSSEITAPDDPCVTTALRFIRDHGGQPIDVSHVVEQAGVSRRTLFSAPG